MNHLVQSFACLSVALAVACHHDSRFEDAPQDALDVKAELPARASRLAQHSHVAFSGAPLPIPAVRSRVTTREAHTDWVFPVAPGVVLDVLVRNGSEVVAGDRLLRFRSAELSTAPATMAHNRTKRLAPHIRPDGHGDFWLLASRTGAVCQVQISSGSRISPTSRSPILTIADLRTVVVVGEYPARQVAEFRAGQSAVVQLVGTEDSFDGTLHSIANVVAPKEQTIEVRVLVANSRGLLMPGVQVELRLRPIAETNSVVIIPSTAVTRDGAVASVVVENALGIYQRRVVQLGRSSDGLTEVVDGLEVGEKVVPQDAT